jgi:F-type H+-transporting ATPase subunit gamma
MAGAYSASVIREAESLIERLGEEGKEVDLYVAGRRGVSFYQFRGRELVKTWVGSSDAPTTEDAQDIADTLLKRFLDPADQGGVSTLYVVYTQFVNMVTQRPRVVRLLPLEVVEEEVSSETEAYPLYEFEPSADEVLDDLLPRYVRSRIFSFLLEAATSELAARQRAMHTATENAEDLIRMYTRLANSARQAEITQEISEIVSGADALAGA